MGVKGTIMVSFQIGSCSFTHRFIVCKGITRPLILGEDFLSHHCFKLGWTDDNKRYAEYKGKVIAIASQVVMDDRIMISHPVHIPARHCAITLTKCPNMFTGRVEVRPCQEFQNKFPNLYIKPMQYNNPDSKWSENIPFMIINLEHDRDIYLGKDTIVVYTREEDKSCDYLEINEITQLTDIKKDLPINGKSITESDLVFSPAQVTEHRRVELKDQEISEQTSRDLRNSRVSTQKFFSVSNEDIG